MTANDAQQIEKFIRDAIQSDIPPKVRVALQVILTYSSGAAHDAALPVVLRYLAPAKVDVAAAVGLESKVL